MGEGKGGGKQRRERGQSRYHQHANSVMKYFKTIELVKTLIKLCIKGICGRETTGKKRTCFHNA